MEEEGQRGTQVWLWVRVRDGLADLSGPSPALRIRLSLTASPNKYRGRVRSSNGEDLEGRENSST